MGQAVEVVNGRRLEPHNQYPSILNQLAYDAIALLTVGATTA
jgi:hypothetical protein